MWFKAGGGKIWELEFGWDEMQGARSESGLLYCFKKRKILYTVATFISYSFMLFVLYFPTFYSNNLLSISLYFLWFLLLYIFLLNI